MWDKPYTQPSKKKEYRRKLGECQQISDYLNIE